MKTEWRDKFGFDYTNRCLPSREDLLNREKMFANIVDCLYVDSDYFSVFEVGCNVGQNLTALSRAFENVDPGLYPQLSGCEPNEYARNIAKNNKWRVVDAEAKDLTPEEHGVHDVVLCAGVLIHVPPDEIDEVVRRVYALSKQYIVLVEYFAPEERMVPYRGQDNMMWLRDYGSLFLDAFPDLKVVTYDFCWKRITGMDNVTWWVLKK